MLQLSLFDQPATCYLSPDTQRPTSAPELPTDAYHIELLRPTIGEARRHDRRQFEDARGLLVMIHEAEVAQLPQKPKCKPFQKHNRGFYRRKKQ